jgi:hypothetical protein
MAAKVLLEVRETPAEGGERDAWFNKRTLPDRRGSDDLCGLRADECTVIQSGEGI